LQNLLQLDQQLLRLLSPPLFYKLVLLPAAHASNASCAVIIFV
jgi:hypothetical protein